MRRSMNALDYIAEILLIIGGLNWGLVGLFNYDIVTSLLGGNVISRTIFTLVGLSAVYAIYTISKFSAPREYKAV